MTHHSTATTTIVHRPLGGLDGYRRIADRATRVVVHAFPMTELGAVSAAGVLRGPGAYALTDGRTVYIGESGRPARRFAEHSADPAKRFARQVYLIAGCDGSPFDRTLALDFQYRLTNQAVAAGVAAVAKGCSPVQPELAAADRSTHDRIYQDALRMLFDGGCRIFQPAEPDVITVPEQLPEASGEDAADSGPMSIGVTTTPLGAEEFELRYNGLWARAYWASDRFIVAAGSEVRWQTNDSVDALTRTRRDELFRAEVLSSITGVSDRRRLIVALAFPSTSIAAKILCGAHTPGKWVPLDNSKAVWLTR
jgi:hypothetical protein